MPLVYNENTELSTGSEEAYWTVWSFKRLLTIDKTGTIIKAYTLRS
jgi:hypothetical protein